VALSVAFLTSQNPFLRTWPSHLRNRVEPVVDVMDAVAVELKAIEYRKKNAS
jgi:hypothetical protein